MNSDLWLYMECVAKRQKLRNWDLNAAINTL